MKISEIYIDGFGVWHDRAWTGLSEGVNVFCGPNEAGKTTLMCFIRSILFGFERRSHSRRYEPFKGRVLFHTTYSEYFKQNVHMFDALDFLAELTQYIPPQRLQLIRRYGEFYFPFTYGLYASRTKGRWSEMGTGYA